jgi:hypothetical protein
MRHFRQFFRDTKALAVIEFALFFLPILLLLFAGVVEITRYVLVNQKLDKATHQIVNFVAQTRSPGSVNAVQLRKTLNTMMRPYSATTGLAITGIARGGYDTVDEEGGDPRALRVLFKRTSGSVSSRYGAVGAGVSEAALESLPVEANDIIIVTEVRYRHRNALSNVGFISNALNFRGRINKIAFQRYRFEAQYTQVTPNTQPMSTVRDCCGYYCNPLRIGGFRGDNEIPAPFGSLPRGNNDLKCACYPWTGNKNVLDEDPDVVEENGNTCSAAVANAFPYACQLITSCAACGTCPRPGARRPPTGAEEVGSDGPDGP